MPIGISLLTLVPGVVGGSERYVRELCRALARVGELEYRAFVPSIAPDAADGLPTRTVGAYRAARSLPGRAAAMTLAAPYPRPLCRRLELDALDAIHFPLSVMLPPVRRPPAATTVLDLQHEFFPEFFSAAELRYRRLVYGWTVRRSRIVITISEHARRTLIERLGLDPERVRTIHLAVDHERFRPSYEERERFLVYPANRWPHKNHEHLFEAFARVRLEHPGLRLVLTGTGHRGQRLPQAVEERGRVTDAELTRLYQTAAALVFPSRYEGFGQPPLEAMACGCPVAVSDIGPLREVCGEAAAYFDPTSDEDMASAILDVLARPQHYADRGVERARRFTWEECARRHEDVYRELAGGS
ncbi:MAG: glycosyltransferase family 4 protein [Gaiellaceae bacterium]